MQKNQTLKTQKFFLTAILYVFIPAMVTFELILDQGDEIVLEIAKKGINKKFTVSKIRELICDYLKAVDLYLLHLVTDKTETLSYTSRANVKYSRWRVKQNYKKQIFSEEIILSLDNISLKEEYIVFSL